MKKLLFLGALLLALAGRAQAQAAPAVVVVEVLDDYARLTFAITRGPGRSEQTQLEFKNNREIVTARAEAYVRMFQQLYDDGFTLQNSASHMMGLVGRTTYVFTKPAR